jgi:hypothetical protein
MRSGDHRFRSARRWLLFCCAGMICSFGCSYESQYVARNDGRARAVWKDNNVVVDLGGAPISDACVEQLRAWSVNGALRLSSGDFKRNVRLPRRFVPEMSRGFWIPVYFGPPIVAPSAFVAPSLLRPPLFVPVLGAPSVVRSAGGVAATAGVVVPGSGSRELEEALAVIALIVLPAVDIGLAVATPEDERSSDAIDQVNVFNDLARTTGTPCSYGSSL